MFTEILPLLTKIKVKVILQISMINKILKDPGENIKKNNVLISGKPIVPLNNF